MPVHSHLVWEVLREDDTHGNRVPGGLEYDQAGAGGAGELAHEEEASRGWCRTVEVEEGLRFRLAHVSPD